MAYYEGEISPISTGSNNNGFGGDGWWGLIALALVFGWGRGGFGGGFGGNYGGGVDYLGYQLGKVATTNDVASGFSTSEIMSDLNSIILGQTQGFAGLNTVISNSTSNLSYNMAQGFHGVDNAICTLGYNMQNGFNSLGHQISDCCCDIKGVLLENRYLNERQTCDIVNAINAGNQRLVDIYTNDKIDSLNRKLTVAEGQLSNLAQTNAIVSALKPCPQPAYVVPNPNCCYTPCGTNQIVQ